MLGIIDAYCLMHFGLQNPAKQANDLVKSVLELNQAHFWLKKENVVFLVPPSLFCFNDFRHQFASQKNVGKSVTSWTILLG